MLTPTGDILKAAAARRAGVGAFNVITVEHAEAIVAGADAAGLPVILQISENAVRFHGGRPHAIAAAARAVARYAGVPVALHLDHVESLDLLEEATGCGFGSVMYDASRLSYPDNVAATAAVVRRCHAMGMWVEGELGHVGGKDGDPPLGPHDPAARTDPQEACRYVEATGVDSAHAMTIRTAALDHELIGRLRAAVPVPLVLHGSSGVPDEELAAAVAHGMVKINVGTALNVAFTRAVRDRLAAAPDLVDPRLYLAPARDATAATVEHLLRLLADAPPASG